MWDSWTNETVVLYKSHAFDAELLSLCASTLVLLSHASCVESTILSAHTAGFMELSEKSVLSFLQFMFHELFTWRAHAALDVSSEVLRAAPLSSAAAVYNTIAAALLAPYVPFDFRTVADDIGQESNPSHPHGEASEEARTALREMMPALRAALAYDTRLVGWTWAC
jgi:hypothetical protein